MVTVYLLDYSSFVFLMLSRWGQLYFAVCDNRPSFKVFFRWSFSSACWVGVKLWCPLSCTIIPSGFFFMCWCTSAPDDASRCVWVSVPVVELVCVHRIWEDTWYLVAVAHMWMQSSPLSCLPTVVCCIWSIFGYTPSKWRFYFPLYIRLVLLVR